MPLLSFLFSPLGRYAAIGIIIFAAFTGTYIKGRSDGVSSYKAKLTRQLERAIAKGNQAEAEALKKFDAQKEIPDDEFARD